jgi:hypothetical protein
VPLGTHRGRSDRRRNCRGTTASVLTVGNGSGSRDSAATLGTGRS